MSANKKTCYHIGLYFFLFFAISFSQPSARYRPFDWLLFKEPGRINSLSEGFEFLYVGTSHGGIYRYNLYSNQYDFPITSAQGLKNNNISSVHFASKDILLGNVDRQVAKRCPQRQCNLRCSRLLN